MRGERDRATTRAVGELYLLWRFLHLLGVVLWIGATAAALLVVPMVPDAARQATALAARRVVLAVGTPGLLLAWIGGLAQLLPNFTTLYAKAGWMHTKLTVALVASGLTGVAIGRLRRIANPAAGATLPTAGPLRGYALGILVLGVVALTLVLWRFGA